MEVGRKLNSRGASLAPAAVVGYPELPRGSRGSLPGVLKSSASVLREVL